MIEPIIPIVSHSFGWLKLTAFGLISTFVGWLAGETMAMQAPPQTVNIPWHESAPFIAGVTAALTTISLALLNRYWSSKDKQKDQDKESQKQHLSVSERLQELSYQERKELQEELFELSADKEKFWRTQYQLKEISEFESRMRAHRFGNEVNRLNAYVFQLHHLLSQRNIEIPEFQLKAYDELMNGLDAEVDTFRKSLLNNLEQTIHESK